MGEEFWELRKELFLQKFMGHVNRYGLDVANDRVLVVGASQADYNILVRAGFKKITLSNLSTELVAGLGGNAGKENVIIDVENIDLPDRSCEVLFAYDVLHHCRSPHRGLCEMMRVAKKHVIICEPNDSLLMSLLTKMGLSFPFELPAVIDNDYIKGGVRDSCVPNYIYRWNTHEVAKVATTYLAEYEIQVSGYSYWDLTLDEDRLMERDQTKLVTLAKIMGPGNFIKLLKVAESILNLIPLAKSRGNKFFAVISKTEQLRPWLTRRDGDIQFNREFGPKEK
jgi:Methyltransferase domain